MKRLNRNREPVNILNLKEMHTDNLLWFMTVMEKLLVTLVRKLKYQHLKTFRLWESIPYTTASQTFTISRTGEKWFVSFSIEAEKLPVHPLLDERPQETFGIDVGVKQFASIANLELGENSLVSLPDSIKIEQLKLAKF